MEEPQKITQEIPDETPDKTSSHAETNFGDETFDGTPIKRGRFGGFNEWIFSLMRPKSKVPAKSQRKIPQQAEHKAPREDQNAPPQVNDEPPIYVATKENIPEKSLRVPDDSTTIYDPANNVEIGHVFHNGRGILLKKKTLAERVRDQIRFPVLKSAPAMIYGIALIVFATGAYLLYSALPTRPDLVLGILMVSIAGNLIINR